MSNTNLLGFSLLGILFMSIGGCKKDGASIISTSKTDSSIISSGKGSTPIEEEIQFDSKKKESDPKKRALLESYPDLIKDIKGNRLIFYDGTSIEYDDGKNKDFETMLDNSDVEDMFYIGYRIPEKEPEYREDPGRSRSETLFRKMYGDTEAAVRKNLVKINWFGQQIFFTSVNGAADSLRAVAQEIARFPDLRPFLKSSGTFYWRKVRGAKRLSAHSYGIAFDIAVDKADYWQWKTGTNKELSEIKYVNRIPRKLVQVFYNHGFIWGGAWYHYDTMHFEFRPEIIHYGCYQ